MRAHILLAEGTAQTGVDPVLPALPLGTVGFEHFHVEAEGGGDLRNRGLGAAVGDLGLGEARGPIGVEMSGGATSRTVSYSWSETGNFAGIGSPNADDPDVTFDKSHHRFQGKRLYFAGLHWTKQSLENAAIRASSSSANL